MLSESYLQSLINAAIEWAEENRDFSDQEMDALRGRARLLGAGELTSDRLIAYASWYFYVNNGRNSSPDEHKEILRLIVKEF